MPSRLNLRMSDGRVTTCSALMTASLGLFHTPSAMQPSLSSLAMYFIVCSHSSKQLPPLATCTGTGAGEMCGSNPSLMSASMPTW